jgi:hypothetical protein
MSRWQCRALLRLGQRGAGLHWQYPFEPYRLPISNFVIGQAQLGNKIGRTNNPLGRSDPTVTEFTCWNFPTVRAQRASHCQFHPRHQTPDMDDRAISPALKQQTKRCWFSLGRTRWLNDHSISRELAGSLDIMDVQVADELGSGTSLLV